MSYPWLGGVAYERFMGRWSRLVARKFLSWFDIAPARSWLDVGCGTGSLTKSILEAYQPKDIICVDPSNDFISQAQWSIPDSCVHFKVGLAQSLDLASHSVDAVVSGLVLNFVPQPKAAILEMLRVTKPGADIGIYVWDYANGMQMLRFFWDAAVELDKNASALDEGIRFPICHKGALEALVRETGLKEIQTSSIEVTTVFPDFDNYWQPFLGKAGAAPDYVGGLTPSARQKLENKLRKLLPVADDGSITLTARAWAVKGIA